MTSFSFHVVLRRYARKKFFFFTIKSQEIESASVIATFLQLPDARAFCRWKNRELKSKSIRAEVQVPNISDPYGSKVLDVER